jgi:hypothetical protein
MLNKILIGLVVLFIIIQFIRPEKNISSEPSPSHISARYATPQEVKSILDKSCNDCHSNNTRYPWYASVQPLAWWLNDHVEDGKEEINFDEFMTLPPKKAHHKMEEVSEMVQEDEMPLKSYRLIHRSAELSPQEKTVLTSWAQSTMKTIEQENNLDLKGDGGK